MRLAKYTNFFLIGIVFLYLLFVVVLFAKEQEKKDLYRIQKQERLESEYLIALNGYRILADFVFDHLVNSSQVQAIMAGANSRIEERDSFRQQLFNHLSPLYGELTEHHFRQLHFHLPDNTSFLRFHRPDKYGDSLVGVRDTVVATNATLKRVSSFEEGRIFNGFRFVYPVLHGQQHVGSVEISISSEALINELSRVFGKQYHFILDRKVVERKVFSEELKNYDRCLLSTGLLHDREVQDHAFDLCSLIPEEIVRKLNIAIAQKFEAEIAGWQSIAYLARVDGTNYVVCLAPIANFQGEKVAYLVSFEEDTATYAMFGPFVLTLISLTLLFAGALFFFRHIAQTGKKLEVMSVTDFLTGIWNRGKGYELLQHEHNRALRYDSRYALIMLDIDRFKEVNDKHGHPIGDYVLKQVVHLVKEASRRTDSFSRWGGEEFLLLLPETSQENALVFAEKIRRTISDYDFKYVGSVTASLGVAEFSRDTPALDEVISRADQALYQAKHSGRNRVCRYPSVNS